MACPSFYIKIIESADREKNVTVQEISDPLVSIGARGGGCLNKSPCGGHLTTVK